MATGIGRNISRYICRSDCFVYPIGSGKPLMACGRGTMDALTNGLLYAKCV
ncbi:hypothetical protein HMPREF3293_01230 [Christensenella minuta]|uniref:Uncharacterized protein n=1 Tax=Christensenella minuta TaxID=626937 RepID=A0A136Q5H5_9FIRM|nr:hypothetical protein HMPREF3293_01230 [Christensenella minuta]